MWPDRVSNPGPPTYESGALPIALRGPARLRVCPFLRGGGGKSPMRPSSIFFLEWADARTFYCLKYIPTKRLSTLYLTYVYKDILYLYHRSIYVRPNTERRDWSN